MVDAAAQRIDASTHAPAVWGAGLAIAARVSVKLSQFGLFVVAARMLAPADLGAFALVAAACAALIAIAGAGWGEVVGRYGDDPRAVDQAAACAVYLGYVSAAIGVAAAAIAVVVFDAPVISILIVTFAAGVLVSPVTAVFGAAHRRMKGPAPSSVALASGELVGAGVGVAALLSGWGVISLGLAVLVAQLFSFAGVAALRGRSVRLLIGGRYVPEITRIAFSDACRRMVAWTKDDAPLLIVGGFLGVAGAGTFWVAKRVVSAVASMGFDPSRALAWVSYRNALNGAPPDADRRQTLADASKAIFPLILLYCSPLLLGLAIVSADLVEVLLGANWLSVAPIVSALAVAALLMTPTIVSEPLFGLLGAQRPMMTDLIFQASFSVAFYFALAPFGLEAAAAAQVATAIVALGVSIWMQSAHAGAPWRTAAKAAAPIYTGLLLLGLSVLASNWWLVAQGIDASKRLGTEIALGALAYVLSIVLVRPSFARQVLRLG